jgi:tetratricopeptide (TPR) repeat protein
MRSLLAQTYYVNNDLANTTKASNEAIDAYEKAGQQPPETLYQLVTSAATKAGDKKAYAAAVERLTAAYPKPEYWADLIHQTAAKPGFPDSRLGLDIFRLKAATGGLTSAGDYMEYAELAIQAGLPAEAKAIVDKGYETKVLGTGAEAERHGRLRDMAKRSLDSDQATLASAETEAGKQANGIGLVNAGLNYYGYGQYDKAVNLIQAGIAKGGLKYPDDAKLHLGIVQLAAGKKADGVATLKSIKTGDADNDLARLWLIKVTGRVN